MRYFSYLTPRAEQLLFHQPPQEISSTDRELLSYALGAALYMPATRKTAAEDIIAGKLRGLMSMVLCLEDAIGDNEVAYAENMLKYQIDQITQAITNNELSVANLPLIFVRVREPQQITRVAELLAGSFKHIAGFVFPKFSTESGPEYLQRLAAVNKKSDRPIYGMPILESPEVIYAETRASSLLTIRRMLDDYRSLILNVRIGATDLSGLFGLRRSPDMTIYDIAPIRDCIADMVNVFARGEKRYVISGPVWEFYSGDRVLKPQLRQSLFTTELGQAGGRIRENLVCRYIDGLIREVILDKANGLTGKTIIHPSHIKPVQALCVVSQEEYSDACSIIANTNGDVGVIASRYANKMNEVKPHLRWAQTILIKSKVYGVFNEQHNFTSLLTTEPGI